MILITAGARWVGNSNKKKEKKQCYKKKKKTPSRFFENIVYTPPPALVERHGPTMMVTGTGAPNTRTQAEGTVHSS